MRRSQERVWSSSLELEALEQEVMRHSPDGGPRDLEVTAAATELTTSAPAACVRACLRVDESPSVRACAYCVSLCMCAGGSLCVCGRVGMWECAYVYMCVWRGQRGSICMNVPAHVRPLRKCLSVCMCLCAFICTYVCMCV